jgi:hypothetical protein
VSGARSGIGAHRVILVLGSFATAWLACSLWLTPLEAQELPDSVRIQLQRLQARIDSLEAQVRALQGQGREEEAEDALARLRAAAQAAARQGAPRDTTEGGQEVQFAGRQRNLQALNPEISVSVDFLGHLNTDDAGEDNFVPREFEFSFQSALDPFSRAKIFVSRHSHGPEIVPFEEEGEGEEEHGGDLEVEEGYAEWVGLPGSLSLKLGKFFQRFGTLNRWHAHALPAQTRSLPHLAFIGEESLSQAGVSLTWLLPFHGSGAYDATVEITRSSNESLFGESHTPSVLGHMNGFWQLSEAMDLDLGLSWVRGRYEGGEERVDRDLLGAEFALTWRPPARALYRGVVIRGGAMLLNGLLPGEDGAEGSGRSEALGLWGLTEVRLDQQWLMGARVEWTEDPLDTEHTAWLVSPTLTWWQSEWVRLRAEYDLLGRSFLDKNEGRLWLQVTFAMGPHKHETY